MDYFSSVWIPGKYPMSNLLQTYINWEESDESKSSGASLVICDQIHFVDLSKSGEMILQITARGRVTRKHVISKFNGQETPAK